MVSFHGKRGNRSAWLCLCTCGATTVATDKALASGATSSCGCLRREMARRKRTAPWPIRGNGKSLEYRSWANAKTRCYNRSCFCYPTYGGRGVIMCKEWRSNFSAFLRDLGSCPPGFVLDRIDSRGNYEPGNCRWASPTQSAWNRSGVTMIAMPDGSHLPLSVAARNIGVDPRSLRKWLTRGLSMNDSIERVRANRSHGVLAALRSRGFCL